MNILNHKLIQGDCLEVLRVLDEAICIFADPLCGAPHNGSSVAQSVMWPSSFLQRYFNVSPISYAT